MPRGSVRCSKRSRIATASWSAPKADPEAFRQNGLFHWLERVYPSARASLASERSAARLAHRSGGARQYVNPMLLRSIGYDAVGRFSGLRCGGTHISQKLGHQFGHQLLGVGLSPSPQEKLTAADRNAKSSPT